MDKNEYDIRLAGVREMRRECNFNYWALLRYKGGKINVGMTTRITSDVSLNLLHLKLGVRYSTFSQGLPHELLHYVVKFDFEIDALDEKVGMEDCKVSIPNDLLRVMLSVGIGTLRGMLVQRTRFTPLDRYPLPVFNISQLMNSLCYGSKPSARFAPLFHFAYE